MDEDMRKYNLKTIAIFFKYQFLCTYVVFSELLRMIKDDVHWKWKKSTDVDEKPLYVTVYTVYTCKPLIVVLFFSLKVVGQWPTFRVYAINYILKNPTKFCTSIEIFLIV